MGTILESRFGVKMQRSSDDMQADLSVEVRTPSRLHFGLLAFSRDEQRQFGGAGLMIRQPDVLVRLTLASQWCSSGRLADRALEFAQRFVQGVTARGWSGADHLAGVNIQVLRVPRPHTGLGSGTQLAMAVALGMTELLGCRELNGPDLAALVRRGRRSAVGAHGFFHGGFIVEGGKQRETSEQTAPQLAPLLMRHAFPQPWRIMIIRPRTLEGLAGDREKQAFTSLPDIPRDLTAQMCRVVLLGLAPALVERNLQAFGEALFELQQLAGRSFAAAQGGVYAAPLLQNIVEFVRSQGIAGVGQSSWGPALYAITADQAKAELLAASLQHRFGLGPGELLITEADNQGSSLRRITRAGATQARS